MIKLIPTLFIIVVFLPASAENLTIPTDLKIQELENQLDNLQNLNIELNNQMEELENKISNLEEQGIKFGIDEEKLGKAIQENEPRWREGDVLLASSTIVGFLGLGSFLALRLYGNRRERTQQVALFNSIFISVFAIIAIHLLVILDIIDERFSNIPFDLVYFSTIIFVGMIIFCMAGIVNLQHRAMTRRETLSKIGNYLHRARRGTT